MHGNLVGQQVRITTDCRKGRDHEADGMLGVYEGDFVYPDVTSTVAPDPMTSEHWTNPRIRLDNGDVIWGAECWWEEVDGMDSLEKSKQEVIRIVTGFQDILRAIEAIESKMDLDGQDQKDNN